MRHVTIEALVPGADATDVFARVADFARYPEFTDAVREVTIRSAVDGSFISDWAVTFRNGIMRWSEQDTVDPERRVITFSQLDGDFESFEGSWRVDTAGPDVIVWFDAGFDLGMPSLAAVMDPIAEKALVQHIESILTGLVGPATTFTVTTAEVGVSA